MSSQETVRIVLDATLSEMKPDSACSILHAQISTSKSVPQQEVAPLLYYREIWTYFVTPWYPVYSSQYKQVVIAKPFESNLQQWHLFSYKPTTTLDSYTSYPPAISALCRYKTFFAGHVSILSHPIAAKQIVTKPMHISCTPVPTSTQNSMGYLAGGRNTSAWTSCTCQRQP